MQIQRDDWFANLEAAEFTTLAHDVRDDSSKEGWAETEVELMEILDLVEEGVIDRDDPQLRELIETLPAVYALHDLQESLEAETRAALGNWKEATDELAEAQDVLVRLAAEHCKGSRTAWLRHVVWCGSSVRTWRDKWNDVLM